MVDKKKIQELLANYVEDNKEKVLYKVTGREMSKFDENKKKLTGMISDRKIENDIACGIKATPGYDKIEEMCLISITTLKKTINGSIRTTRTFLYKFAVGLHMTLDEANEFFKLCGGELRKENPEDYICMCALRDKDSIYSFCDEYEKYIEKKIRN